MEVEVVRWPDETRRRERLVLAGEPRLLLVEDGQRPPVVMDCLEDWVRVPASEQEMQARLDALEVRGCTPTTGGPQVAVEVLYGLPARLRRAQGLFDATGGLHAAGLFDTAGDLLAVREDVGRHNALDKLVGWAVLQGRVPLDDHVLLVSGRTSYDILQKAIVAGLPMVCGISAPSSLALDLAERFGVTLVGFLRDRRFNVYARPDRIAAHG